MFSFPAFPFWLSAFGWDTSSQFVVCLFLSHTSCVCVSHRALATLVTEEAGLEFLLPGPLTDSEKLPLPFFGAVLSGPLLFRACGRFSIQRLSDEVGLSIGFVAGADAALLEALLRAADRDFLGTTQGGAAFVVGSLPLAACALCKPAAVKASSSLRGGGGGGFLAGTGADLKGAGIAGNGPRGGAFKGGALRGGGAATVLAALPM